MCCPFRCFCFIPHLTWASFLLEIILLSCTLPSQLTGVLTTHHCSLLLTILFIPVQFNKILAEYLSVTGVVLYCCAEVNACELCKNVVIKHLHEPVIWAHFGLNSAFVEVCVVFFTSLGALTRPTSTLMQRKNT